MPSADLTEADADRILASMSDVLRAFDGADDTACNVAFCRDLDIVEYEVGDGLIDTSGELDEVFAVPQDVKVARSVDFCNNEFTPGSSGCASGGSFIVERAPHDVVLWAHEYGHVRGLDHRDPDDPNAVMRNGPSNTSRSVNSQECTAYLSGAPSPGIGFRHRYHRRDYSNPKHKRLRAPCFHPRSPLRGLHEIWRERGSDPT